MAYQAFPTNFNGFTYANQGAQPTPPSYLTDSQAREWYGGLIRGYLAQIRVLQLQNMQLNLHYNQHMQQGMLHQQQLQAQTLVHTISPEGTQSSPILVDVDAEGAEKHVEPLKKPENSWYTSQYAVVDAAGRVVLGADGRPKRQSAEQALRNSIIKLNGEQAMASKKRKRSSEAEKEPGPVSKKVGAVKAAEDVAGNYEVTSRSGDNAQQYTADEIASFEALFDDDEEPTRAEEESSVTNGDGGLEEFRNLIEFGDLLNMDVLVDDWEGLEMDNKYPQEFVSAFALVES